MFHSIVKESHGRIRHLHVRYFQMMEWAPGKESVYGICVSSSAESDNWDRALVSVSMVPLANYKAHKELGRSGICVIT